VKCERCNQYAIKTDERMYKHCALCIQCRVKIKRHINKWLERQREKWRRPVKTYQLLEWINGEWVFKMAGTWWQVNEIAKNIIAGTKYIIK
jgi:hypothetical protein